MKKSKWKKIPDGSLIEVLDVPDQSLYIKTYVGVKGIVMKNLDGDDGVVSSTNLYSVLVDNGKRITLHFLDMKVLE
jgi:hypothetical protein